MVHLARAALHSLLCASLRDSFDLEGYWSGALKSCLESEEMLMTGRFPGQALGSGSRASAPADMFHLRTSGTREVLP